MEFIDWVLKLNQNNLNMQKEEVLKFYQKYKLYIFPMIVSLAALILIIFIIYPQTEKLINNQKSSEESLKKLNLLESKVSALESYDEEDLNMKVNTTLNSYPVDKDFAEVTGLLQNLTAQAGFSISTLSLGSGAGSGSSQSYNIKLEMIGPVDKISTLLANIENSPRLMRVSSIETTVGRDIQGSTISLSVEVLYAPAPQEFGNADSSLPELSDKDQEILAKLVRVLPQTPEEQTSSQLPARGRANPFE